MQIKNSYKQPTTLLYTLLYCTNVSMFQDDTWWLYQYQMMQKPQSFLFATTQLWAKTEAYSTSTLLFLLLDDCETFILFSKWWMT